MRRVVTLAERRRFRDAAATYGTDGETVGLAYLHDGTLAATTGHGTVHLIRPGASEWSATVRPHAANAAVVSAALDCDGDGVLTGGDDGRLFRVDGGGHATLLAEVPGQHLDVIAVNAGAGLRAVAAGREIRVLDRGGGQVGATADHPSTVTGLAFQPKGKRLAASHYGGVSLWWTSSLGKNPRRLPCKGSHIGVTWSPDGSTVVSSLQENTLQGWDLESGKDMAMSGYPAKVRSLGWMSKPMTLATSGAGAVIAWKFSGGGPQGKPPLELASGVGHMVTTIAVRPGGRCLAIGFDDGRAVVCEPHEEGERLVRLRPSDGDRITALAWSADGARLALGSQGGSIDVFETPATDDPNLPT